jgi:spermidine synthase
VVLAVLIDPLGGWLVQTIGAEPGPLWQWLAAFGGTFVLLLPATAAMGATLPAMEGVIVRQGEDSRAIAALYAANTFGAVAGALAGAFWLVPALGLARTALVCAALNIACAAAALALRGGGAAPAAPAAQAARGPLALLAATGFLGIGFEVLVVRVLSQVTEDTVYTFALLLAVYLGGTAIGAAWYRRRAGGAMDAAGMRPMRNLLLGATAAACLSAAAALWGAQWLREAVHAVLGPGMAAALAAEAVLALAAFALPTIAMGALFCHLAIAARGAGIGFGRALACNTLGAAIAPLACGVLLVPSIGPKFALLLVSAAYLLPIAATAWRRPWFLLPALAALALALFAPALRFVDVPEGGNIVSYREGVMAAVSVVEDDAGVRRLRIDNRQQEGSSDARVADARQALLPLLLHPAPKRALFLGLGTGVTAYAAAADSNIAVDAVELLPEVIAASEEFAAARGPVATAPRLVVADARRFVRASTQSYDLIVSDNFHPARSGSGALYTVEHFRAVRRRLAAGGVFCQWLPLHQLDLDTLRSIVRSFQGAYPGGWAMLATNSLETPVIGLVGRADTRRFDPMQVRERVAAATLPEKPAAFGLADEFAVLGSFIAGPRALARFAGDAPANTDDHPVVAYLAPRVTYAPDVPPRERLFALLAQLAVTPEEVLEGHEGAAQGARMAAYWTARTRFLEVGREVKPSADVRRMLAQVREPLLSVLRTSPDFRPAYDPLLRMALAQGRSDVAAARALLAELAALQPARPEAAQALGRLDAPLR